MSLKYSHDQVLQSIQPNRKKYEAIALSTAITMELEDLMEQKGISKKELAAAAGVSPSYLSQVFSGDKLINISMLAGISNEFDVVFRMEIQDKKSEEFLYADNRSLVEQMNQMALKPTFKVGDWVEYRGSFGIHIGRIDNVSPNGSKVHIHVSDAYGLGVDVSTLRKLSHSEVVVPITISGTVRPAYNEDGTIDDEQFQLLPNGSWDGTEMFISFDALDSHTRKLVESLLKAQEEEK